MKKVLLKALVFIFVFVFIKPGTVLSQSSPYCPTGMVNNATNIALSNTLLAGNFPTGDYYVTIINDNWYNNSGGCFVDNQLVHITSTSNLSNCFAGAMAAPGICIPNPNPSCPFPDGNAFQSGSTSIVINHLDGSLFLILNYTDYNLDDCIYIAVPVHWNNYPNLDWNTSRAIISWTTYDETDMDHFSIEKSVDGANFYKIGQVAATNTQTTHNYSFTSTIINRMNYYRVVAIDIDCNKQYSAIVWARCPNTTSSTICPDNFTPPNLPADCSGPVNPAFINGPNQICDSSKKLFRLMNVKGSMPVTWSFSPSGIATVRPIGRFCLLTPTGTGAGTLTATYVKDGVTYNITKAVTIGLPQLTVYTENTLDACSSFYTHTATVYPFPGTTGIQYQWYVNGSPSGSGLSRSWTLPISQNIFYEVRYNSPCGVSHYYGSTNGLILARAPEFTISPNPAKSMIKISRRPLPCGFPPQKPALQQAASDKTTFVKVFDMYGALRKTVQFKTVNSTMELNASGLPSGWYFIHIIKDGKTVSTEKVWLEK